MFPPLLHCKGGKGHLGVSWWGQDESLRFDKGSVRCLSKGRVGGHHRTGQGPSGSRLSVQLECRDWRRRGRPGRKRAWPVPHLWALLPLGSGCYSRLTSCSPALQGPKVSLGEPFRVLTLSWGKTARTARRPALHLSGANLGCLSPECLPGQPGRWNWEQAGEGLQAFSLCSGRMALGCSP